MPQPGVALQTRDVRAMLLQLKPDQRVDVMHNVDVCGDCGEDLRLPDGKRRYCRCQTDD